MTTNTTQILADLRAAYGSTVSRAQIAAYEQQHGHADRSILRRVAPLLPRVGRGLYGLSAEATAPVTEPTAPVVRAPRVPRVAKTVAAPAPVPVSEAVVTVNAPETSVTSFALTASTSRQELVAKVKAFAAAADSLCAVPKVAPEFVPFGEFDIVRTIVRSRQFHPVFITGLSGNGKTFQVEQACAMEKREYLRANITEETDEDDLIGGFRLKNGETVFELGPVPVAMLRGAVLLIDEVDLAGPKVMCLQSVMEGRALTIKKLGITIHPTAGFTVFATANTKGRGNEDGRFVGTNLLNEAFLERFPMTLEQQYPGVSIEKKILAKTYAAAGQTATDADLKHFETLAKWADAIRTTYTEGGIDDVISTRRLVHIIHTYAIFGDMTRAVVLCLNRFDGETKAKFLDFWTKLTDPTATTTTPTVDWSPGPDADASATQF